MAVRAMETLQARSFGAPLSHLLASSLWSEEWLGEGGLHQTSNLKTRKGEQTSEVREAVIPSREWEMGQLSPPEFSKGPWGLWAQRCFGRKDILTGWAGNLEYPWCSPWFHYYIAKLEKFTYSVSDSSKEPSKCHQSTSQGMGHYAKYYLPTIFVLATLHSMWDLSSPTRDQICTPGIGSTKFQPTGLPQKSLTNCF